MNTTRTTLARAWNRIFAIRLQPDEVFYGQIAAIEREAIERHPDEADAIRLIVDSYAYRARKPDMDRLPAPLAVQCD